MKRRGFLGALAGAIAAASFDPDLALWVPGAKTISIPAPAVLVPEYGYYENIAPFNAWANEVCEAWANEIDRQSWEFIQRSYNASLNAWRDTLKA